MQWIIRDKKTVLQTVPFNVERLELCQAKTGKSVSHPFFRLHCPDWANILAITEHGDAVLVKQSRVGPAKACLEIPGGMIDDGEDPLEAAKRELEEETGYVSDEWIGIGRINPNPAIMTNTLHMFLATNSRKSANRVRFPDENEAIEVVLTPFDSLLGMIEKGQIDSALAALTIYMGHGKAAKA